MTCGPNGCELCGRPLGDHMGEHPCAEYVFPIRRLMADTAAQCLDRLLTVTGVEIIAEPLGKFGHHPDPIIDAEVEIECLQGRLADAEARARYLATRLNTPEFIDFSAAVVIEAAHQLERWGVDHDGGKTDADWFWLLGYLGGKALHNPGFSEPCAEGTEKRLHRIITVAAAAANWHAQVLGRSNMRPGIAPPAGEVGRAG